ncbi:MAG: CHAT domain-containing protein [Planctomycetes bacterium]|nr:CHAT domain-containing protein [Planctomycetota bacterium]
MTLTIIRRGIHIKMETDTLLILEWLKKLPFTRYWKVSLSNLTHCCMVGTFALSSSYAFAGIFSSKETPSPKQYSEQAQTSFQQGDFEGAIENWSEAVNLYKKQGMKDEQAEAFTRLSRAYESIGQYKSALQNLEQALVLSEELGNWAKIASTLGNIGNIYISTGNVDKAYRYLNEGLDMANEQGFFSLSAIILNNLGNLFTSQNKYKEAFDSYVKSLGLSKTTGNLALASRTLINAATVSIKDGDQKQAKQLLDMAVEQYRKMRNSHDKAYGLINIGLAYHDLRSYLPEHKDKLFLLASELFNEAAVVATDIYDHRATSYSWGNLGKLYEEEHRYQEALDLTRRAIYSAQKMNVSESLYQWQWQSGRLLKALGKTDDAISAYRRAIHNIQSIREEMSLGFKSAQTAFRKTIRSVYFELVDLLLQRAASFKSAERYEPYLDEAREAVELLKLTDLRDYFRDECVDTVQSKRTKSETVSQSATIVYPILLHNRTELLVSLPAPTSKKGYRLKRFSVPIGADALTQEVRKFRWKLEKRTTREYLPHAQKLYDWLILPLEKDLESLPIDTLVFVPDGPLRTIPMAALHDGEHFLISKYALATTPGLNLTDPRPLDREGSKMLAVGLTESVQGYPPLPNVSTELETIRNLYGDNQLVNEEFLSSSLESKLRDEQLSIVHIASHGQFRNDVANSFLLTYDDKLTMNQLSQFIGLFQFRDDPLELLILSACETAAGDDRASLGLAGVAVKAGARSAIATLWYINDQASSLLISEFYREIQDPSISRSIALQQAQLKLIKEERFAHPCYWSPFLLINNWL